MALFKLKTPAESGIYVAWWIREAKLWCVPDTDPPEGARHARTGSLFTDEEFTNLFRPYIKPNDIPIPK